MDRPSGLTDYGIGASNAGCEDLHAISAVPRSVTRFIVTGATGAPSTSASTCNQAGRSWVTRPLATICLASPATSRSCSAILA